MRIVQLIPGTGDAFYCQNCIRDFSFARELRRRQQDVVFVPVYLPVSRAEAPGGPVFFGAVRTYLDAALPAFRRLPLRWRRALDHPRLLRWAAGRAGATDAASLDRLTLSMLKDEDGVHAAETDRLIAWLRAEVPPDVVQISNALLLGLAPKLKAGLGARIVCLLQDEDVWLEALPPASRRRAWDRLAQQASHVDAFVAPSRYYAGLMRRRAGLPEAKLHIVPPGVDVETGAAPPPAPAPPAVGYLSRFAPGLGFDVLADAFAILKRDPRFAALRLRAAGGAAGADRPFLRRVLGRLRAAGLAREVEAAETFDPAARRAFLRSVSVLSVPAERENAFGLQLLEAFAEGVPAVQPRLGAFPELIEATGGGVLYEPNAPAALAAALAPLLADPARAAALGRAGREAARGRFSVARMADRMMEVYHGCGAAG
jgi:glycosyltransferase involved in cell wall biosynthesis